MTIVDPAGGKTWQRPQSFTVLVTVAPSPEKMWKTMFPEVKTGTRIVRRGAGGTEMWGGNDAY